MIKKTTAIIIILTTNLYCMDQKNLLNLIHPEYLLNFENTEPCTMVRPIALKQDTKYLKSNLLSEDSKKKNFATHHLNSKDIIENITSKFKKDAGKSDLDWKVILENLEKLTSAEQKNLLIQLKTICPAANVKQAMQTNLKIKGYNISPYLT